MVGTLIRRPLPPVSDFIRTLLDDANATAALATLGIVTGVFTPTLTPGANVAASTAYQCQYVRVSDIVVVSGRADIDPTAATQTVLGVSLPVASNFGVLGDCAGTVGFTGLASQVGGVYANVASDRAQIDYFAVSTANNSAFFIFAYRVI